MKVLVLLGSGPDVAIAPQLDLRSGRVRADWLVHDLDPASRAALDLALELKDRLQGKPGGSAKGSAENDVPRVHLTALHLGPASAEVWLRRALAGGCDRAVRVWYGEEAATLPFGVAGGSAGVGAAGKAIILAAAATACGFDLILAGTQGVVESSGQLGLRLAAELRVPCVTRAVSLKPAEEQDRLSLEIRRSLERGYAERVQARLPLVITVAPEAGSAGRSRAALTASALLRAQEAEIPVWTLADLGVPQEWVRHAEALLAWGPPRPRRPRLVPLPAPEQSLPAFERVLRLIEGSVRHREGRVIKPAPDEVAEQVFRTLRDEGWLDHLRAGGRRLTRSEGDPA
jgi:electron transfer flavoprotein beta subunit